MHVEEFSMRMQFTGYDETFRAQVVRSALNAYRQMVTKDQQGKEPRVVQTKRVDEGGKS